MSELYRTLWTTFYVWSRSKRPGVCVVTTPVVPGTSSDIQALIYSRKHLIYAKKRLIYAESGSFTSERSVLLRFSEAYSETTEHVPSLKLKHQKKISVGKSQAMWFWKLGLEIYFFATWKCNKKKRLALDDLLQQLGYHMLIWRNLFSPHAASCA